MFEKYNCVNNHDDYCLKHNSFVASQSFNHGKCQEFFESWKKFSDENEPLVRNDESSCKTYAKNLMEFNVNEECDFIAFPSLEDLIDILKSRGYVDMSFFEDSFRCSQDERITNKGFEINEKDRKLAVARVIVQS